MRGAFRLTTASAMLCMLLLPCGTLLAQEGSAASISGTKAESAERDPFEDLIKGPDKKKGPPLEMYELELMRLVAIMHDDESGYATVKLPDGKYYTVVKGTKVGMHNGRVSEIFSDRIIVRQEAIDHKGALVEDIRELKLREEAQ